MNPITPIIAIPIDVALTIVLYSILSGFFVMSKTRQQ